jgi:hypothetical protein
MLADDAYTRSGRPHDIEDTEGRGVLGTILAYNCNTHTYTIPSFLVIDSTTSYTSKRPALYLM